MNALNFEAKCLARETGLRWQACRRTVPAPRGAVEKALLSARGKPL